MRQIYVFSRVVVLATLVLAAGLGLAAQPARAQASPTGMMKQPGLQPLAPPDESAPPALPGAGTQALSTAPSVAKPSTGDPTAQLFTAINAGNYNSAQDAVSRGADLNAQNSLGETPLDLSVGLNRNSITFMLLAARNESGGDNGGGAPITATPASAPSRSSIKTHTVPAKLFEPLTKPNPSPSNNPGTPNPSAGFLGFGATQ